MIPREIALLPGTLCTGEVFSVQVQALQKKGHQCKSIEFGYADSVQKMAAKTLESMTKKRFSIVAFSMGGMVAFELLRQVPERIASLVLVASNSHQDLPGRAALRQAHLQTAMHSGLDTLIMNTYMPNYLVQQRPEHQQLIVRMAESLGLTVFEAQLQVLAERPDSSGILADILCPTLIVGGEDDPLCPVAEQQKMHQQIPHSQLQQFSPCGHFVSLEQADQLSTSLVHWFSEVTDAQP